jgi:hypothetical protein
MPLDIIRGVPTNLTPDPISFDGKDCSLILFEISFCGDLGCHEKLTSETKKYHSLLCAL